MEGFPRENVQRDFSVTTHGFGPHEDQVGDLYLPASAGALMVCLLHGGFWREPYGRDEMTPLARDLAGRGFAVWNLEYRRLGGGGGWPATFDDVRAGIAHLGALAAEALAPGVRRVAVVGHSAGGHLALWSASRVAAPGPVRVSAVAALAPVADLAGAHQLGLGRGAVAELLGGAPGAHPGRLAAASPLELLPLGVPQLVMHGTDDDTVPIELSRAYVERARAAGDTVELRELPGAGHMEFLDPFSRAHHLLCAWLEGIEEQPAP